MSVSDRMTVVRRGRIAAGGIGVAVLLAGCAGSSGKLTAMPVPSRPCSDVVFPIYFAQGSDALTPVAQQAITFAVSQVKGCQIGYVNVLGLTDAAGPATQNLELSRRRADAVAKALEAAGLHTPKFEVEGGGAVGAISDSGTPVPLRRKTEVIIHPLPN